MNGQNEKVDNKVFPVLEGGTRSNESRPDATISKGDGTLDTRLGEEPTAAVYHVSVEEINRLIREIPEEVLLQRVKLFTKEQLASCCAVDPTFALLYCRELLSSEQFDYCIERDPETALVYAKSSLTEAQIHTCYRLHPRSALGRNFMNLDVELRNYCIRKEPGISLREAFAWDSTISLTEELYEYCFREAPSEALKNPAAALAAAADRMDDELFLQCALADPGAALQYAVGRMLDPLFERCAMASPAMALQYAPRRLSNPLLKQCIRTNVWVVLLWAPDRLTDGQVLRHYPRYRHRIRQLLRIQPSHPLAIRLLPLCNQLDPFTVGVVTHAISSAL
jgi:hypothetical protein